MAKNVTIQVIGGQPVVKEVATVGDALKALNLTGTYAATVNGDAANLTDSLDEYSFVMFAPSVKGGAKAKGTKKGGKKGCK